MLVYRDRALILIHTCDTSSLEKRGRALVFSFSLSLFLLLSVLWTLYISVQKEWKFSWSTYQKILLLKCSVWLCLQQWTKQGQCTVLGNATQLPTLFDYWHPSQHIFYSCSVGPSLTLTVHSLDKCSAVADSNRQVDKLPPCSQRHKTIVVQTQAVPCRLTREQRKRTLTFSSTNEALPSQEAHGWV